MKAAKYINNASKWLPRPSRRLPSTSRRLPRPKLQFLDIIDHLDHPDGVQISWKHFLSMPIIPCIICVFTMRKSPSRHPKSSKTQFLDILDLPDHPDDDQNSWKHFLSMPMVPRIPEMYHMCGHIDKIPIKTPKILQNPSFWTFLTFLIILMLSKNPGNTS